jgi:hypothetical protein
MLTIETIMQIAKKSGVDLYDLEPEDDMQSLKSKFIKKFVCMEPTVLRKLEAKAAELDRLKLAIKSAMILYPYKVHGEGCTYESYNQGWQDALGYVESEVE